MLSLPSKFGDVRADRSAAQAFVAYPECVMSTKRFAVPSQPLHRGWTRPEYCKIVVSRPLGADEYARVQSEVGSVYFIGEQLGGDTIKIGWSRDPVTRLQQLQVGNPNPLQIIGCVAANRLIEPALHMLFASRSVSGEWFTDPEYSIRRWLKDMTFGQPIERCRLYMAGAQWVTWHWDAKAEQHFAEFSEPQA